ncbi:hypothetical protein ACHAXM_003336 [Skeletonema potamos]
MSSANHNHAAKRASSSGQVETTLSLVVLRRFRAVSTNKLFIIFAGLCLALGLMNLNFSSTLVSVKNDTSLRKLLKLFGEEDRVKVKGELSSSSSESPSSFSVDILSVASIDTKRKELLNLQKRTFASHTSVRNFFHATEVDDFDPTCYKDLTWKHVADVSTFCRKRPSGISYEMRHLRGLYGRKQWIAKKSNPIAYLHYKENRQALPDYFIIMDDDTYYNMETFQQMHKKLNSSEPTVVAGCLVRLPIHEINFTFPFGGFGAVFSKGALEYLFHPIHCPDIGRNRRLPMVDVDPNSEPNHANAEGICNQMSKNTAGELKYFENGNSLLDLIYKYVNTERYRDVAKWDFKNHGGFCMHSDWVMGFFVNFYNVSKHVEEKFYENVPQARMESFKGSHIYAKPTGYCKNNEGICESGAMICHKPSVQWVEKEVMKWKTD